MNRRQALATIAAGIAAPKLLGGAPKPLPLPQWKNYTFTYAEGSGSVAFLHTPKWNYDFEDPLIPTPKPTITLVDFNGDKHEWPPT